MKNNQKDPEIGSQSQPECPDRLVRARNLAASRSCTHLLVSDLVDIQYLCGFRSTNAFLLISKRKNLILTDFRYQEAVQEHCRRNALWQCAIAREPGGIRSLLSSHLPERAAVAFQSDDMTVDGFAKIKKACPGRRFVPLARAVSDLFIVKTKDEVAAIKKAAAIADKALHEFCAWLAAGVTEQEAVAKLEALCANGGSQKPSFDTIMLFGKNTALPHGRPGGRKLKRGDFVLVDFGCVVDGLCSDMTRTFVFGPATPAQKKLYALVLDAQTRARAAARAGLWGKDLDAVGRQVIEKAGFGPQFGHGLGHGVGRRIHENPRLSVSSDSCLEEGSVVTIEPGVYLPGFGGVRIEDMMLLDKCGSEPLTRFPRELLEL